MKINLHLLLVVSVIVGFFSLTYYVKSTLLSDRPQDVSRSQAPVNLYQSAQPTLPAGISPPAAFEFGMPERRESAASR